MTDRSPELQHQADLAPGASALSVARGGSVPSVSAAPGPRRRSLSLDDYEAGILSGDRAILARAITLVESTSDRHRRTAQDLLARVIERAGGSRRVGITGVPGVGKSTFIERLGVLLADAGRRVAVLAVDPSSGVTGGSILGDKTRMARLAAHERAFIRPSPSAGTLGGVASKTRETMLLCEAAGFDVVLVETVGVGQSETVVAEMTDFFLALMLPGAGDELQGIKRGLIELTDMIAVNKADGENVVRAQAAMREYRNALHFSSRGDSGWTPPVVACSALEGGGVAEIWSTIDGRVAELEASGELAERRRAQMLSWMWAMVHDQLGVMLKRAGPVREALPALESGVLDGRVPPTLAARRLLEAFLGALREGGADVREA